MNFGIDDIDLKRLLPNVFNRITCSDLGDNYRPDASIPRQWLSSTNVDSSMTDVDQVMHIIDTMGLASAKAQGLHHVITTGDKLKESEHVLYLMTDDDKTNQTSKVVGLLKIGYKKLFLIDRRGVQHEMNSVPCVLDFYVHESYQRTGFGKRLFDFMMRDLNIHARQLAIDRPSTKFLAFLSRHYQLSNPVHQGNHFTVFEEMFPNSSHDDDDAVQSRWTKLRRSDPSTIGHCKSIIRTSNRNSYPPVVATNTDKIREASSSVASVVFGQLRHASPEMRDATPLPRGSYYSPNLERTVRTDKCGSGGSTEKRRSAAMDSSFNIFGVPSPDYSGSANAHRG